MTRREQKAFDRVLSELEASASLRLRPVLYPVEVLIFVKEVKRMLKKKR